MRVKSNNPISQSQIDFIEESPEGLIKAPPGYLLLDREHAILYIKMTGPELATGWSQIGFGAPGSVAGSAAWVLSFNAVRQVNPLLFPAAIAMGYAGPGDGTLRIFVWVLGDTRPDDDSVVLESTFSSAGRWVQAL